MFKTRAKIKRKQAVVKTKKRPVDDSEIKKKDLIKRALELLVLLEQNKVLYKEMDQITLELLEMGVMQGSYGKQQIALIDNFEDKNTAFRVARIKRFEIKKI